MGTIKKVFVIFVLILTFGHSYDIGIDKHTINKIAEYAKKIKSTYEQKYQEYSGEKTRNNIPTSGMLLRIPINETILFSKKNCDRVIRKKSYISCYSDFLKISKYEFYTLTKNDLTGEYIKDRPPFYKERDIPTLYAAKPSDYKRSGYDRGHIRSHASTAYNADMLYETYSMVNIWPQTPGVNRKTWIKAEKYERLLAYRLDTINVFDIAVFKDKSKIKTIGSDKVAVPDGFYKILYSDDKEVEKCFYYENKKISKKDIKNDKIKNHLVDCSKVRF